MIPRKSLVSVAVLALVALLAACSSPSADAAAVVDGTDITDAKLEEMLPAARVLFAPYQTPCAEGEPEAGCTAFVLSLLVQSAAVSDWAEEKEVTPSSSEINDALNREQTQAGGADAMRKALAEEGGTLDSVRELLGAVLTLNAVQPALADNLSREDIKAIFEGNERAFATIDTAHILVDDEVKAQELAGKATTENFADLAAANSVDPGSAENGGELGPMPVSGLVPEYANAVLDSEPGKIIGPVESQFGWHIIWVKDITQPAFEDVEAQIEADPTLVFGPWMEQRLREASVEVNPRFGTLDPTTGQIRAPETPGESPSDEPQGGQGQPEDGQPEPSAPPAP